VATPLAGIAENTAAKKWGQSTKKWGQSRFVCADEGSGEGRKAAERALPELRDAISLFAG